MIQQLRMVFSKLRYSLFLLVLCVLTLFVVSYFLPNLLSLLGLKMNKDWPTATRIIVQLTVGSWSASTLTSVARVYVWLRAMLSETSSLEQQKERDQVKMVQNLFLWILGLMTVLSAYVTQWFSKGQ